MKVDGHGSEWHARLHRRLLEAVLMLEGAMQLCERLLQPVEVPTPTVGREAREKA